MKRANKHLGGRAAWLCLFFMLTQCGPPRRGEWKLLSDEFTPAWKAAEIPEAGKVLIQGGEITLQPGQPMTGVRFDAEKWKAAEMPRMRYSIEYEAMRVEGNDFFGTVTFPVNESHVSLVVGGWGGTLVGISSIDEMDASENNTRGNGYFENKRWHQVRIEVRDDELKAWINGKLFVNTSTKGHKLGMRDGEIEKCTPFGFASYLSQSRVRNVVLRRL
ncbi:family 16 glycoside hydrolase [Prosthecobacter sp.]|uniref:family 16 glycoside hydrolase n=1 Tax=Prosthecobacter sp. TaxID=1965333 RepID=UPI003783D5C3